MRHGIPRVDRQVDDGLLELAGIDLRQPELLVRRQRHLDVLADQPLQQLQHVGEQRVEAHHFGPQHLLAAEGQELAREVGGALAGAANLGDELAVGIVRVEAVERHLAETDDGGEQVVEVVGHAAGELAHRFHLLRLPELLLEALEVGDVA